MPGSDASDIVNIPPGGLRPTLEPPSARDHPPGFAPGIATPVARLVRPGLGTVPLGAPVAGTIAVDGSALAGFVARHRRLLVLTGAGVSTAAGIPDYRDAEGRWKGAAPMSWQAFSGSAQARQRYWARSLVGWPRMAFARPTAAHRALARLEALGRCHLLVTQNVDGLHQRAGSRAVVDLHGRLDRVVCLACGRDEARADFQARLIAANVDWPWLPGAGNVPVEAPAAAPGGAPAGASTGVPGAASVTASRPDGDADLDALDGIDYDSFRVPPCRHCAGALKPDVVFFGDSVPRERIARVSAALATVDAVVIVGSSLTVFSGWRFARDAAALGLPIAAVNLGASRADPLLALKVIATADAALAFALDDHWPASDDHADAD